MSKLSKGLGCVLAFAMVPAFAQVPAGPISSPTTTEISPRQFAPMKFHGRRLDGGVESTNWSGYAVTGTSFTNARGSWKQPEVNCTETPNTYAAFWVGIDGYASGTVEQTGTIAVCTGTTATYYAWYEFYPTEDIVPIGSITVSPGDRISAEVGYNGSNFVLRITDDTTQKSFSTRGRVAGAERSSAEWIAEAPCCTSFGGILPLSDFGIAPFGWDYTGMNDTNYATNSSVTGPISDFGGSVQAITMVNGSNDADEAVPSALTTDGSSFTVIWKSE
jgi:hypothetical protein